jgi:WD40 repeat protein
MEPAMSSIDSHSNDPELLQRSTRQEGSSSAYILQADQPPPNTVVSVLVAEHYRSVYRLFNFLMDDVGAVKALARKAIAQAVWNRDSYRVFERPRVWILKIAWQAYLDREKDSNADPIRVYTFFRIVENLDHGEAVKILEAFKGNISNKLEEDFKDGNLSINPGEWPLPNIDHHQLQLISNEILALVDSDRKQSYKKITGSEAVWAFILGVMILAVVYWFNTSTETKNDEPFLRAPLSISPTPQLVELAMASPSMFEGTEWSSITSLGKFPFPVSGIDVSNDGEIYAAGLSETQIEFCSLDGTNQVIQAESFNPSLDEIAISSTEQLLASGAHDGSVLIWKWLENGENRRLFTLRMHPGHIQALAFSPTGKLLAAGTARGTWLWKIEEVAQLIGIIPGEDVRKIAFSDNDQWLATLENENTIWIRSLSNGEVAHVLTGFQGSVFEFDFSPENRFVVAVLLDREIQFLNLDFADGDLQPVSFSNLLRLSFPLDDDMISALAISANGDRLIFGTTRGDIYAVTRSELSDEREPFRYFEKLSFNQFTDEEIHLIAGCGQYIWHQVLLNRPASTNFEIAQIELNSVEKFNLNIGSFQYLGDIHQLNFNSSFYKILENDAQSTILVIHEPNRVGQGVEFVIDFLDKKVGSEARIELFDLENVLLEYLSGNWSFYITDEPVFLARPEQFDDVQWRSEWESGNSQQTLRWKQAGKLFEIILLAKRSGDEIPESALLMQDDLLDFARQIITHMKSTENSP